MIYRTKQEDIDAYYAHPAINQSSLKEILDNGVQAFYEQRERLFQIEEQLYYEEKEHYLVGQAVDCYITQGEEIYNNKYYFSQLAKKPGATIMSIVKMVFDAVSSSALLPEGANEIAIPMYYPFQMYEELIYIACNSHEYYMNRKKPTWQEDERINTVLKGGLAQAYWEDLQKAGNRQILSDNQNQIVSTIIYSLTTHRFTKHLFTDDIGATWFPTAEYNRIDIIYQMPVYFDYHGVPCKGLPDEIRVDHRVKRIFTIDIKTTGHYILKFNRVMKARRYDIQGAFYYYGILNNLDKISELIGVDVTHYTLADTAFIAESTKRPGVPLVFPMNPDLMKIGFSGDGKDLLGWSQAIDLYQEWEKVGFSIEEKYKETNGVLFIDQYFEYSNE